MPTVGSTPMTATAATPRPAEPPARRGSAAAAPRPLDVRAVRCASSLLLALGFVWFVWRVPAEEVALDRNADGIVVLTGGASRITTRSSCWPPGAASAC